VRPDSRGRRTTRWSRRRGSDAGAPRLSANVRRLAAEPRSLQIFLASSSLISVWRALEVFLAERLT
jgi:hypothetical protein